MDETIYLGVWCHIEERSVRAFFNWYFRKSLQDSKNYPQNLTNDQWFEKFKLFHETEWQKVKNSYEG